MKNVHQLTLILMQTLYLYVEDGVRIYIDSVMLLDIFCKAHLVLMLDFHEFLLCSLIIGKRSQLADS